MEPMWLEVIVPVHNEAGQLATQTARIRRRLDSIAETQQWPPIGICLVENGSRDQTAEIALALAAHPSLHDVRALVLDRAGKGNAVRQGWLHSNARFVAFTDIDEAASLDALPEMLEALLDGNALACGSRYLPGSSVRRSALRTITSQVYRYLARLLVGAQVRDLQCGLKAADPRQLAAVLHASRQDGWLFDTEIIVLAQLAGRRITEIPVEWTEGVGSQVRVRTVAPQMFRQLLGLRRELHTGVLTRRLAQHTR